MILLKEAFAMLFLCNDLKNVPFLKILISLFVELVYLSANIYSLTTMGLLNLWLVFM